MSVFVDVSSWKQEGSAQSSVNTLGDSVYLIPGVVPRNGMCTSTRFYGRACHLALIPFLYEFVQRGLDDFKNVDADVVCGLSV
jgi:hypothetical protein